jgi:hypothetical protein
MAMLGWIIYNHPLFDSSNSGIQEIHLIRDMNVTISSNKTLRDKGILNCTLVSRTSGRLKELCPLIEGAITKHGIGRI